MSDGLFKVACFDIETSNLNADFGLILCAVFYDVNTRETKILRWDKMQEFKKDRVSDKELCIELKNTIESYDVIIGYNTINFDMRFIRARMMKHGLSPIVGVRHIDLYWYVKSKIKISNNKLDTVSKLLGTSERKTEVDGDKWIEALVYAGTPRGRKAMDYIVEHCVKDTIVLAEVFSWFKDMINVIRVR